MKKNNWILPYLKRYIGVFILAILLGTLTLLFGSGLMFTSGYLISKAATKPESILMVYVPIVGVRTFGMGRAVLSYLERLTGHQFILKIISDMRSRVYKLIEPDALIIKSWFGIGDFLGIVADDIEHLQDFYLKTLLPAIVSLVIYVAIIVSVGLVSFPLMMILFVLIGLLIFVAPLTSYFYMKAKNRFVKEGRHELYLKLTDAVFGISDWVFSGRYETYIQRHKEKQESLLKIEMKKQTFGGIRDVLQQTVLGFSVICSIYWATGMTNRGEIPGTLIAAFALVTLSLLESFLPISTAVSELSTYNESLQHLEDLEAKLDKQWTEEEEKNNLLDGDDVTIILNQVSFYYHSGTPLLKDFNLKINQGEKIAILGPSGAGKSTLLKLIQGAIVPISGEVLVKNQHPHERVLAIPKLMAVLNQKPYLFNTSVMNNIRLGNPEATDEAVYWAARQVKLHKMIASLPNGYRTSTTETGQRFSGGERQRMALARILLQNTPVVLIDEPTVGLDPMTEKELIKMIFEVLKDKTIIWVTHHLSGMENMDRIIFLDQGTITMAGSHHQLINNNNRYRRLYTLDHPETANKDDEL